MGVRPSIASLEWVVLLAPDVWDFCSKIHRDSPVRRFLVIVYLYGAAVRFWLSVKDKMIRC